MTAFPRKRPVTAIAFPRKRRVTALALPGCQSCGTNRRPRPPLRRTRNAGVDELVFRLVAIRTPEPASHPPTIGGFAVMWRAFDGGHDIPEPVRADLDQFLFS
jgi:hypothetical protein